MTLLGSKPAVKSLGILFNSGGLLVALDQFFALIDKLPPELILPPKVAAPIMILTYIGGIWGRWRAEKKVEGTLPKAGQATSVGP